MSRHRVRRRLLKLAIVLPVAVWAPARAADDTCVNMAALTDADKSLRASLNFQVVSSDPKRVCRGCAFFTHQTLLRELL